jgi:hypothetical protein
MKSAILILIPNKRAYFIPTEHKLFDKSGGISIGFIERSFWEILIAGSLLALLLQLII